MAGILGGISLTPFPWLTEPGRLTAAIDTLLHRGPDDRGAMVSADRRAFLGHRLFALSQDKNARQPISSESGRLHLCHDGLVSNHRDLREALRSRGHVFKSSSDGEPALHLYEDDGLGFPAALAGAFALAIYDEFANSLTLARDRCGAKPLYYYHDGPTLLFASEIKAILALLPPRSSLCAEALRGFLHRGFVPGPRTIFENIRQLPPGSMLRARRDLAAARVAVDVLTYAHPIPRTAPPTRPAKVVEALDERLLRVVGGCLDADVDLGVHLDGRAGSSLIAALAAESAGRRIRTITVNVAGASDGRPSLAREVARRCGTRHVEEEVALDPMDDLPALARRFDQPCADLAGTAWYRIGRAASRHVKVLLTGHALAELCPGDGSLELGGGATRSRPLRSSLLGRLLVGPYGSPPNETHDQKSDCEAAPPDRGPPAESAPHRARPIVLGDMLVVLDHAAMACSVECRSPLLDHRILDEAGVEATTASPNRASSLFRAVAKRHLPAEWAARSKAPRRLAGLQAWKHGLRPGAEALLAEGTLVNRGILDAAGLRKELRPSRRPSAQLDDVLWKLFCLEHWARAYLS